MCKRKRLVIGDIHGYFATLKKIYDAEQPDEVIIVGDYFDNFKNFKIFVIFVSGL